MQYKVVGTDLNFKGKIYKEGAILITALKMDMDCLEEIVEKKEKKFVKVIEKIEEKAKDVV